MSDYGISAFNCFRIIQPTQISKLLVHKCSITFIEVQTRRRPWATSHQVCVRLKAGYPDMLIHVGEVKADTGDLLTYSLDIDVS